MFSKRISNFQVFAASFFTGHTLSTLPSHNATQISTLHPSLKCNTRLQNPKSQKKKNPQKNNTKKKTKNHPPQKKKKKKKKKTYLSCFLHHNVVTVSVTYPQNISSHTVPGTGEHKATHGLRQTTRKNITANKPLLLFKLVPI